ncbi:MAG: hypothetical protein COA78_36055 [Blastopirellula sp.]|nr:MAG: hypothetical protein COA78_36055 [Blastopirellula sp.]
MKWIPKFRFSLRTLFVVTTLLGVGLVPLVVRLEQARQQKEAVAWVLEHGGTVYYGDAHGEELPSASTETTISVEISVDPLGDPLTSNDPFGPPTTNPNPFLAPVPSPPTRVVSWLEGLLGTDFFYPVIKLELRYCDETDISPIRQFSQLQTLDLWDAKITDYKPLAKLKSLKSIDLGSSEISDLSPLSELAYLESISINDTNVKDLRPLANLSQLKIIDLSSSAVTDISPLASNHMLYEIALDTQNLPKLPTPSPGSETWDFGTSSGDEENQIVIEYNNCDVDFSPLFQLKKLKRVTLTIEYGTEVDIDQLKVAMPNCEMDIWESLGGPFDSLSTP